MAAVDVKYIPKVNDEVNQHYNTTGLCFFCQDDLSEVHLREHLTGYCNDSGFCPTHDRHMELDVVTGHCKECLKAGSPAKGSLSDGEEHEYGHYPGWGI